MIYDSNTKSASPGSKISFTGLSSGNYSATFSLPGYSNCGPLNAPTYYVTGSSYKLSSWYCQQSFSESGLPSSFVSNYGWNLIFYNSSGAFIVSNGPKTSSFNAVLPTYTHSYTAATMSNSSGSCTTSYSPNPSTGTFIAGSSNIAITYSGSTVCTPTTTFTESGLPSGYQWDVNLGWNFGTSSYSGELSNTGIPSSAFQSSLSDLNNNNVACSSPYDSEGYTAVAYMNFGSSVTFNVFTDDGTEIFYKPASGGSWTSVFGGSLWTGHGGVGYTSTASVSAGLYEVVVDWMNACTPGTSGIAIQGASAATKHWNVTAWTPSNSAWDWIGYNNLTGNPPHPGGITVQQTSTWTNPGTIAYSTTSTISVQTPTGTYPYYIPTLSNSTGSCTTTYTPSPQSGSFTAGNGVSTTFGKNTNCTTWFSESGVPSADYSSWQVVYNGVTKSAAPGTSIRFYSSPGSHAATFSLPGYSCSAPNNNYNAGSNYTIGSWSCTTTMTYGEPTSGYVGSYWYLKTASGKTGYSTSLTGSITFSDSPGTDYLIGGVGNTYLSAYDCWFGGASSFIVGGSYATTSYGYWDCQTTFSATGLATYVSNNSYAQWGINYNYNYLYASPGSYSSGSTVSVITSPGYWFASPLNEVIQGITMSSAQVYVAAGASPQIPYSPPAGYANVQYIVPVSIGVSSGGTQNPMLVIDSANYASYENPTLTNVEFLDSGGNVINSWLETYPSTSYVNSLYWLKLTGSYSTAFTTVYMSFASTGTNLLNTNTGQDACWIAQSGQDSGSNVFAYYQNFCDISSLPIGWSTINSPSLYWHGQLGNGGAASSLSYGLYQGLTISVGPVSSWFGIYTTFVPGSTANMLDMAGAWSTIGGSNVPGIVEGFTTSTGFPSSSGVTADLASMNCNDGNAKLEGGAYGVCNRFTASSPISNLDVVSLYAPAGGSISDEYNLFYAEYGGLNQEYSTVDYDSLYIHNAQSFTASAMNYLVIEPSQNSISGSTSSVSLEWIRDRYNEPYSATSGNAIYSDILGYGPTIRL